MTFPKVHVELSLPPSVNGLYANTPTGRVMSKEGKDWKKEAGKAMIAGGVKRVGLRPYRVMLYVFLQERRRDISNMLKITEDTVMGVIHDNDVWVDAVGARRITTHQRERVMLIFSQTVEWHEDARGMCYYIDDAGEPKEFAAF